MDHNDHSTAHESLWQLHAQVLKHLLAVFNRDESPSASFFDVARKFLTDNDIRVEGRTAREGLEALHGITVPFPVSETPQ